METSPCCHGNSVTGHQIATIFCSCHDNTAVVPCTKFCSDHCIKIEMRVKWNFHRIWIAMEKPLVKCIESIPTGFLHITACSQSIFTNTLTMVDYPGHKSSSTAFIFKHVLYLISSHLTPMISIWLAREVSGNEYVAYICTYKYRQISNVSHPFRAIKLLITQM